LQVRVGIATGLVVVGDWQLPVLSALYAFCSISIARSNYQPDSPVISYALSMPRPIVINHAFGDI
jgi:hypothetical protein